MMSRLVRFSLHPVLLISRHCGKTKHRQSGGGALSLKITSNHMTAIA
jgi:hypothetical protein